MVLIQFLGTCLCSKHPVWRRLSFLLRTIAHLFSFYVNPSKTRKTLPTRMLNGIFCILFFGGISIVKFLIEGNARLIFNLKILKTFLLFFLVFYSLRGALLLEVLRYVKICKMSTRGVRDFVFQTFATQYIFKQTHS
jgi:hypothetical protein